MDEHDRAVGAVLIAEAILASCDGAVARLAAPAAGPGERWRAAVDLHDNYPEVWRHLDRARGELARRGANTMAFDELRPHAPRSAVNELGSGTGHLELVDDRSTSVTAGVSIGVSIDRTALDAARRGVEMLKLALPGADWSDIRARTEAVGQTVLTRHDRPRLIGGVAALALAMLAATAFLATHTAAPRARSSAEIAAARAEALAQSLADIQSSRRADIIRLQAELDPLACDAPRAHALVRLLVLDGRNADARDFADRYTTACGDDAYVDNWASAPDRHRRDDGAFDTAYDSSFDVATVDVWPGEAIEVPVEAPLETLEVAPTSFAAQPSAEP